ncbi:MAG: HdeD family acid-resistance protein [Gemmatimonadales bacterium]
MITDDIKRGYRRAKWGLVLRGLLGIGLGVFILARPLDSVAVFALVVAIWALADGFVMIVHSFELRPLVKHWGMLLLSGIVSAAFGVAALYFYPVLSLTFAVTWTALWLATGGVFGISAAVQEKKAGLSWGWTMTFGILALVAGAFAIFYPGITLAALMGTIAGFGIVGGTLMLVGAGKLQSFERDVRQAMESPSRA